MNNIDTVLRDLIAFIAKREMSRIEFVDEVVAELNRRINNG